MNTIKPIVKTYNTDNNKVFGLSIQLP